MPAAIAAIALPTLLTAATGTAALVVGAQGVTLTGVLLSVGSTALLSTASYLMRPNVDTPGLPPTAAPANGTRSIPIAQPVPPRQFAYGQVRTGGVMFFQDNANPYLLIGLALSDGEIESLISVYFGDDNIPLTAGLSAASGSRWSTYFDMEFTTGDDSQAVSAFLLANFPATVDSNFRQRGVARAVMRLGYGADATSHNNLWGNGISPSLVIEGVRVYDPRDGYQLFADKGTWQYSNNPVLCVAHALTQAWGVSLTYDQIDWASVAEAANVCDETVTYLGDSKAIFQLAGIFQAGSDFGAQVQDMLSSFRGAITYSGGQYQIVADDTASSSATVTDDDILEFREWAPAGETRSRFNAISAAYYDSGDAGRRSTTTPYEMTYEIAEEGLRETAVTLPFTSESHSAQIIQFRELIEGRDGRRLSLRLRDWALWLQPKKDVITVSSTEVPIINGTYRVQQIDMADAGVIVTLRGYSTDPYADPTTYLV